MTLSLDGRNRQERATILDGAIGLRAGGDVSGKRILLVDDVLTTGATLGACARTLMAAGAAEVNVAALARVVRGH